MHTPTRGRTSKIDQLPEEVKRLLDALLRDKGYTQQQILAEVNKQLSQLGIPKEEQLSRSGLNRYASRMEAIGKKMRETNAIAQAWVTQLGDQPQGQLGRLVTQMVHTLAFELTLDLQEGEDPANIGVLKDLALTIQRLEAAEMQSLKREKEIRQAFAEQAASAVEAVAKAAGLTAQAVSTIKNEILGVA